MYVAATVLVSKAKAKMDIHVVDSGFGALGYSSRWLGRACGRVRACVRACVRGSSPPTPQPDEDALRKEGRRERRIRDPPESALPPGPGNTASELGSGDRSKARSKCRTRWIRIPTRWPVTSRSRSRSGRSCIAIDGSVISACWRSLGRG